MNQAVIDMLNEGRARELLAVSQYLAQHYELADQMFNKLATTMKDVGIQEMKHAEAFAERVLFLGGTPTEHPHEPAKRGLSIEDMLRASIDLEVEAINLYNKNARLCAEEGDNVSRRLFQKLAEEEEEHLDMFQTTLDLINKLGASYLATLVEGGSD